MQLRTFVGAVALVAGGFLAGALACLAGGDQAPGVVVYEDGSGRLPAGTTNGVLGDLSGRGFCLEGELCND